MTKTMTAAAALLLGVALAATAQANNMRQSATPPNDTQQQTTQTGTTAAPQVTKQQKTRKLSKQMTARRHLASKRTGQKLTVAKMTRHNKLQQTARLHHRGLRGQQQSTAIGSSTMPNSRTFDTGPTTAPPAGSGSSMMPQNQDTSLQNQQPQNPQLNQAPIR